MNKKERTEQKLGFDRIRSMAEAFCSTESARQLIREAPFLTNEEEVTESLSLTDEMRIITMFETGFPDSGYVDTTPFLIQLEHESYYLDTTSIGRLKTSLDTLRQIVAFFNNCKENKYPYLREMTRPIMLFPEISRRIDSILDRFGEIKDSASEELQTIRRAIKDKESTISKRITVLLKKGQQEGIIDPDSSVTVRDGRMLLPVSAANKRKIAGLVIDESSSGKTIFIEPIEIVELTNLVKELQFAEQREILKILIQFSDFLRPYREELLLSSRILTKIDFIWAKARLALSMEAGMPVLSTSKEMSLKSARHPLLERALQREGKEIVPLTVTLNKDKHILLISGPNAGGKSVCLKTVGLLQYMLQCGFLIPASQSSELKLFDEIFIDIGDEQSIDNDLSTYSSHLNNMRVILEEATEKSLVLIDEFGAGTEPTAGGAIAEAILSEIEQKGSFGIITTHYGNLKFYASSSKGVINGGMQFDVQNIKPLFKLETGIPGSSFAFELARKIGLSEDVVKKAEERAGTDFVDLERHLKKIAKNKKAWEERLARIKSTDRTLENITDKYQKELAGIQAMKKKIIDQAREEAASLLNDANKRIESTIKEIRESQAEKERTKSLRRELNEFSAEVIKTEDKQDDSIAAKMEQLIRRKERREERRRERDSAPGKKDSDPVVPQRSKEKEEPIKKGDKIRITGGDLVGEVMKVEGSSISIVIGSVISKLSLDRVEKISNKEFTATVKGGVSRSFSVRESDDITQRKLNFKPTIDIRGERLESAVDIVTRFVDDAVMVGAEEIRILHGKGNGILREELRKYLKTMGGVKSFRDEHLQMGGSGITVVTLD